MGGLNGRRLALPMALVLVASAIAMATATTSTASERAATQLFAKNHHGGRGRHRGRGHRGHGHQRDHGPGNGEEPENDDRLYKSESAAAENQGVVDSSPSDGDGGHYSKEAIRQLQEQAVEYSSGLPPVPPEIHDREAQLCYQCEQSIQIIGNIIQNMHKDVINFPAHSGVKEVVCSQIQNNDEQCVEHSDGSYTLPVEIMRCALLGRQCYGQDPEIALNLRNRLHAILDSPLAQQMVVRLIAEHCPAKWAWSNINPGGVAETVPLTCQYYIEGHGQAVLYYAAVGQVDLNYCYDIGICHGGDNAELESVGWWYNNAWRDSRMGS